MIRVAIVVYSYFPRDPRVTREAKALADSGMEVDLICLRGAGEATKEYRNGIDIFRINLERKRTSKIRYLFGYSYFFLTVFLRLSCFYLIKKYDVVHVHNMPDFLVFTALIPKFMGAKIILDLHDPMPEIFMTKYNSSISHPICKFLSSLEQRSIQFANLVFTPNISFKNIFISRGCPSEKIHIIMNSPDEQIFNEQVLLGNSDDSKGNGVYKLMYHGVVLERNGLDTAINAVKIVKVKIPNLQFDIYGEGEFRNQCLELIEKNDLQQTVEYHGRVSLTEIARKIASTDLGIIPNKRNPFTEYNFPTRIFEYLCFGKPVITPQTVGICDYFDDNSINFFKAGDPKNLAEKIIDIYENSEKQKEIIKKGNNIYQKHRWQYQKEKLVILVKKSCKSKYKAYDPQNK